MFLSQEDGVTPDQHVIGTLLGNAAFKRHYEYLVHIMKVKWDINCCNSY